MTLGNNPPNEYFVLIGEIKVPDFSPPTLPGFWGNRSMPNGVQFASVRLYCKKHIVDSKVRRGEGFEDFVFITPLPN